MPSIANYFLMEAVLDTFLDSTPVTVRVLTENGHFYDIDLMSGNLEPVESGAQHLFGRNAYDVKRGMYPVTTRNQGPIRVYVERISGTIKFEWQENLPTSIEPQRIFDFYVLSSANKPIV